MLGEGLKQKIVSMAVAGAVLLTSIAFAVVALGLTVFFALTAVLVPWAAALITCLIFVSIALAIVVLLINGKGSEDEDDDEEPRGLASRAIHLIRNRPIVGAIGGLGAVVFLLRNPGLAAIAASLITEGGRRHSRKRRSRR